MTNPLSMTYIDYLSDKVRMGGHVEDRLTQPLKSCSLPYEL